MHRHYYTYIMSNYSRTLYVGCTNDLERRVWQHKCKVDPQCFTARYNCNWLVYYAVFPSPRETVECERRLKGWRRERKLELIRQ